MAEEPRPTLWGLIATHDVAFVHQTWDQAVRALVGPAPWLTLTARRPGKGLFSYLLHVASTGPVHEVRAYVEAAEHSPMVPREVASGGVVLTRGNLHVWRGTLSLEEFLDRWAALEDAGLFCEDLLNRARSLPGAERITLSASNGADEVFHSAPGGLVAPANLPLRRLLASLEPTLPDFFTE